ncbi:hypothetical protein G6F68_015200 [Rhizopus microsporus]|nr:hypothetical protein G6F68_015200 [Rhizopus microsporus]
MCRNRSPSRGARRRVAAQRLGKRPGLRFVDPHERGLDGDAAAQAQAQRHLLRLDRVIAAVGIAREVGFAHAADQHVQLTAVAQRSGQRQEKQIAAGHERVGQAIGLHLDGAVARHGGIAHLAQHLQVQQVVFAQPRRPLREARADVAQHVQAGIQFNAVPLASWSPGRPIRAQVGGVEGVA